MNLEVRTQTHKPDQTKINIYRFDMAKSAAQLLYGPVLVHMYEPQIQEVRVQSSQEALSRGHHG